MNDRSLTTSFDSDIERRNRIVTLLLAVAALTIPVTYFSGNILWRWGAPVDLAPNLKMLESIPDRLGAWRLVSSGTPIAPEIENLLELRGHVHRVYEHPATGQRVSLLLLLGPAGPLVRHPPEICYQSGANELLESEPVVIDVNGRSQSLRLLSYQPESIVMNKFLVAYGFGSDGEWDCPSSPRVNYGGKPVLYKLQALTEVTEGPLGADREGLINFLQTLLPVLTSSPAVDDPSAELAQSTSASDGFPAQAVVGSSWQENADLLRSRNR